MKVLGLTGNIASGKSTVARMLERMGARVIDADLIAREVVEPEKPAWVEIVKKFGPGILGPDGAIDRRRLGEIVFGDEGKRKLLMDITHPRIKEAVRERLSEYRKENVPVVVIEAALIVERGGLREFLDGLIVVTADEESQIERLVKRSGHTREEALARIGSQMPAGEKALHADYIIDNSGTEEETEAEVKKLWEGIIRQK
ncbi:MAG TPA: dephospho-CoA kinase [Thermodesulfobacteriota bacterium]|nr:dephospho-CoA kinase [Thermodesulfobacteriota bacterium]